MGWGSWASFVSTKTYSHNSVSIPKNQVRTWSKGSRHLEGGCQNPTPRKTLQEPLHLGLHSEKERRLFISTPMVEIWSASRQDHSSKMLLTNFFQARSSGSYRRLYVAPGKHTDTLWHTHSPELSHICFQTCLCQQHLLWSLKYIIQHYLNI